VGSVGAIGAVYHIPAGAHPDYPAVAILEDILTSSPDGRLYKALVKTKLANKVEGTAYAWHDPGVIEITASVEPEKIQAARKAMLHTLDTLAKEPITEEEVNRSKTRFNKDLERLLTASDRLAVRLSEWSACGDWRLFFLNRDRLTKVTAEDVNKAAKKYLLPSNRTVGTFLPTKTPRRSVIPATPDVAALVKDYKGGVGIAAGEEFDPSPENIEKRVTRGTLPTGIKTAFLVKKTRGEMMTLRLNLRFGNLKSLAGKTAAANLLGTLLRRGTEKYTRNQLKDELDRLGAQLSITSSAGALTVVLQVKKPNLPAALKLLEEILRHPTFPADELEVLKRERLAQLEQGKTDPRALAITTLRRSLGPWPKDDVRYNPTIEESIERVKALSIDDVKDLYKKQLGGTTGELTAVGDFDAEMLAGTVGDLLKGWKSQVDYERIPRPAKTDLKGSVVEIQTPDKANAVYLAGLVFPMTDADPSYPALEVGNYLLGAAPLASRLSNRVRGKEGLSYGIMSFLTVSSSDKAGQFLVFAITNPKNINKVDTAIKEEIDKFLNEGPTTEELREGKRAFLEKSKVERSSDASLAEDLGSQLFLGRTFKFVAEREKKISELDPQDVKDAFKKVLVPAKLTIIKAGDLPNK
jgi:zinc protease